MRMPPAGFVQKPVGLRAFSRKYLGHEDVDVQVSEETHNAISDDRHVPPKSADLSHLLQNEV